MLREANQERTKMNKTEIAQARWNRIRAAYQADLPALTVARARVFLKERPECGPAWKVLGSALLDLARHREGEEALRQAISLCPPEKLWIPLSEMGYLHKARGDYKRAAVWYRRAIEAVPEEASGYIYLGGVFAKAGRLDRAEAAHRAATRCKDGCRDEAFLNLGLVLRAQERYEEAAECLEEALKLDPKSTAAKKALRDVRHTLRFLKGSRNASDGASISIHPSHSQRPPSPGVMSPAS
jgi:tetratricopeptide (TPR) repeat protein